MIVKFVYFPFPNLVFKQQTDSSHFHSFKSPSAFRRSKYSSLPHFASRGFFFLFVFFKHNLSKSSWPTVCVLFSLPHFQSSVRLEAPEHCAAGDLCDHDEVCCTHHSSAVINSARPQRNLWLSLRGQRSLLAPQPRCEATVRGKTETVHSLSSADRVLSELESGGGSGAAGKRGRLFVVTYL